MEPSVKIIYSESNHRKLQQGSVMSLGFANGLFEQRDFLCSEHHAIENIVYEITYSVNDEERTYTTSQNLGDGAGTVINHLRKSTISALQTLSEAGVETHNPSTRNPFSILRNSCQNMLQFILPQLEVYCLAYRTMDIVDSYFVEPCDPRLLGDLNSLMRFIQDDSIAFLDSLEEIIRKNPGNTSLISSIEILMDKTERYVALLQHKELSDTDLVTILNQATERATFVNSKSILNCEPPPLVPAEDFGLD